MSGVSTSGDAAFYFPFYTGHGAVLLLPLSADRAGARRWEELVQVRSGRHLHLFREGTESFIAQVGLLRRASAGWFRFANTDGTDSGFLSRGCRRLTPERQRL